MPLLIAVFAGVVYFERDKIHITHQELIPKEDCDYFQSYMNAQVALKNLSVGILLEKGCLPSFVQGGHYQGSIGDSPRSYFTYVSSEVREGKLVPVGTNGKKYIIGGWTYHVRDWNVVDGPLFKFEDYEVGRLIPCKDFKNPIPKDFQ